MFACAVVGDVAFVGYEEGALRGVAGTGVDVAPWLDAGVGGGLKA